MNRLTQQLLERLADRVTALVAGLIGSSVSTFRAAESARQLSLLEDLARQYESEGKLQIAQHLRQEASDFALNDPADQANQVIGNLLQAPPAAGENADPSPQIDDRLPAPRSRRKRSSRKSDDNKD